MDAEPISYCGITFAADSIGGTSVNSLPEVVARPTMTGLAMHALVSRSHAYVQMALAVGAFGIAGAIGLNEIGALPSLNAVLIGNRGIHVAAMILLIGSGARLFSTAWDPRHVLTIKTSGDDMSLALKPTPEPFELIKTLEDVEKRFGYKIELYPDGDASAAREAGEPG